MYVLVVRLEGLVRTTAVAMAVAALPWLLRCSTAGASGTCSPGDQDGISGGVATLDLTVTDTAFTPIVLKAQNLTTVTLTLRNLGSLPHDLAFDCLATPNDQGCPTTSCFPDASSLAPVAPDASATVTFQTPNVEGIYGFHTDPPGAVPPGQFIVQ
jgi:hypothetical protein